MSPDASVAFLGFWESMQADLDDQAKKLATGIEVLEAIQDANKRVFRLFSHHLDATEGSGRLREIIQLGTENNERLADLVRQFQLLQTGLAEMHDTLSRVRFTIS